MHTYDLDIHHRKMEYLRRGEETFCHLILAEKSWRKTRGAPELHPHCRMVLRLPKSICQFSTKASHQITQTGRNCGDRIFASECPEALNGEKRTDPWTISLCAGGQGGGSYIGKILKKGDCPWVLSKADAWLDLGVQGFSQSNTCERKKEEAGLKRRNC